MRVERVLSLAAIAQGLGSRRLTGDSPLAAHELVHSRRKRLSDLIGTLARSVDVKQVPQHLRQRLGIEPDNEHRAAFFRP